MRGYNLLVNIDPQRYCSRANTHQYHLVGREQQWDYSTNPPSWWPCEVAAPVQGDPVDITGIYEVHSQQRNENGCEEPVTPVTDGPSHFKIAENAFMSDVLGATTLSLYPCTAPSSCTDEFDPTWGYILWIPQYGGWISLVSSRQNYDNICAVTDSMTSIDRVDNDITLRLTMSEGSVALQNGQGCQTLSEVELAEHMNCSSLEVLHASLVQ
jgi:hypothetical protein